MSFRIYRHAKIKVPYSLAPKDSSSKEIEAPQKSFKGTAQKAVGGVFALSGTAILATPIAVMMSTPLDLAAIFVGSAAAFTFSSFPVIGSYFNKTYKYVPFMHTKKEPKAVEEVYFEPYRNWDEVFVSYTDRLVDRNIECDTPVGFTAILSRDGADRYIRQQTTLKGNSNISWSGIYGEVSEYSQEIFFRTKEESGSVLFHEETSN